MREGIWCVLKCVTWSNNDRNMELPPLNHTDGYPVTWVAEVGQTTAISMSFHRRRQEVGSKQSCFLTRNRVTDDQEVSG